MSEEKAKHAEEERQKVLEGQEEQQRLLDEVFDSYSSDEDLGPTRSEKESDLMFFSYINKQPKLKREREWEGVHGIDGVQGQSEGGSMGQSESQASISSSVFSEQSRDSSQISGDDTHTHAHRRGQGGREGERGLEKVNVLDVSLNRFRYVNWG